MHLQGKLRVDLREETIETATENGWSYTNGLEISQGVSRVFVRNHEIIRNTSKGWCHAVNSKIITRTSDEYSHLKNDQSGYWVKIYDAPKYHIYRDELSPLLLKDEINPMEVLHTFYREGFERPLRNFENAHYALNQIVYILGVTDSEGGRNDYYEDISAFMERFSVSFKSLGNECTQKDLSYKNTDVVINPTKFWGGNDVTN